MNTQYQSLTQLTNRCWQGTFPDGIKTDTHCFESVYGGAFIRDLHAVCGDGKNYRGETLFSFDAKHKQVIYRYWNSLGGVSDGKVSFRGKQLVFPNETYHNDGQDSVYRTLWTLAENQYTSVMEQQVSNAAGQVSWQPVWTILFKPAEAGTVVKRSANGQLQCLE